MRPLAQKLHTHRWSEGVESRAAAAANATSLLPFRLIFNNLITKIDFNEAGEKHRQCISWQTQLATANEMRFLCNLFYFY